LPFYSYVTQPFIAPKRKGLSGLLGHPVLLANGCYCYSSELESKIGEAMPAPLTEVRQISKLAYGFMASKALFAALNLEIFGHISRGARTAQALSELTGVPVHRMETLIAALVSTGVLVREDGDLANAPTTGTYLVPGAPAYFGDYYRFQIGGASI
jgi:hypothetical protein